MIKKFNKIKSVQGELSLAGDKSISHRAIIFSAMANGESIIKNLSHGEDVKSTFNIMQKLGVKAKIKDNYLSISGVGYKGFIPSLSVLDCGNSGTSARLITGLLSAQNFESVIIGDESLSNRPMKRIVEPLTKMGAKIKTSSHQTLPLTISPANQLQSLTYEMPIASAQVKSSILIAGLHCDDQTCVVEKVQTRNHTEKMLGLPTEIKDGEILCFSSRDFYPFAKEYFVPGDISTSAFHIILTLLSPNSELLVRNVSLNPTRTGFIDVLKRMGANISFENVRTSSNEEYGDLIVKSSELKNVNIDHSIIPNIIDEIPILTIAGIFAKGDFEIQNANELRVKESDRIKSLCTNLKSIGLDVLENEDGFTVSGKIQKTKALFDSFEDHRIAMAFAVLSMLMENGGEVKGFECVNISNPQFENQISQIIH